jgi:thiopurine S-methyltransferase
MELDKNYWNDRYQSGNTTWDAGSITTPIKEYFDQVKNKGLKILIPGCGYGHEAEYLWKQGFQNLYVADVSEIPLMKLKKSCPDIPDSQLLIEDFFQLKQTDFDLIVEQTFFCALNPNLRKSYGEKMHQLLKKGGKLVGVLFNKEFHKPEPPFGGTKEEYLQYFTPHFDFKYFELCTNSIPPRAGNELFVLLINK